MAELSDSQLLKLLGTFLVQTATNAPANAQVLSLLSTGILKVAASTGVVSVATAGTDYVAAAGVSGGQTATAGTGAGDSWTWRSTSHATKGAFFINDGSPTKIGFGISATSAWSGAGGALIEGPSNSILMGASTDIYFNSNAYFASAWKRKVSNLAARWQMFQGIHTFSTAPTGAADSTITWNDQITIDDTNGIKIGTTSSQKVGAFGATPIARPSTTGTTGVTAAGSGTALKDDTTMTGGVGSTAYTTPDIIKHLKNLGWIAP